MIVGCSICEAENEREKRLKNPAMLVKDNPYLEGDTCPYEEATIARNRDRLWEDRRTRRNTATGRVYSGIMDMRLGG